MQVNIRKRVSVALVTLLIIRVAFGAVVSTNSSTITPGSVFSYATFGNGDVVFQLDTSGLSQCYGFWMRASDARFRTEVAALFSAVATRSTIKVYAGTAQLWSGNTSPYCLVYSIVQ